MPLQLITPPYAEPLHLTDALAHIKQDAGIDDAHVLTTISAARKTAESRTWRQLIAARYRQTLDSFPGIGQFGVPWGKAFGIPGNAILLDRAPVLLVESIDYIDMQGLMQTVDPATYTIDYTCSPCRITPVFGKIWPIPMPQIAAVGITFLAGFASPIVVDVAADTVAVKLWKPLIIGDPVRLSNSGGALPAPLLANTDYFVIAVPSPGVYQLSSTAGGAALNLTDAGSGISFLGEVPGDILAWIKLRIGSLDQYREEGIAMNRGKMEFLPFADSLLDSWSHW